jgi:hypothetical protein
LDKGELAGNVAGCKAGRSDYGPNAEGVLYRYSYAMPNSGSFGAAVKNPELQAGQFLSIRLHQSESQLKHSP